MIGRLAIEDIAPTVECGRFPARAVVGELVPVSARCYREGHALIGCHVVWQAPDGRGRPVVRMRPGEPGTDRWHATIQPDAVGRWRFSVEAFGDPYLTWRDAVLKKVEVGQGVEDLANDLADGALLLDQAAKMVPAKSRAWVLSAAAALRDEGRPLSARVAGGLEVGELLWRYPVQELATSSESFEIWVDRERALFSAWYEFFPRSEAPAAAGLAEPGLRGSQARSSPPAGLAEPGLRGSQARSSPPAGAGEPPRHGTFATAAERLPAIAAMGFDVVYLPPIHPIGRVNRKGPDNSLVAGPDDVGSPWAIGSAEGGHDAIHPQLGTPAAFRRFVSRARELGMEVALDLALQCAPDHPWVSEHPEWFTTRADGRIAYAENPPKKYQDIYPVNFDNDPDGIRAEVLRVVRHWMGEGVRIFRVDNPHTKPLDFWHWLIWEIKKTDPDVLFLAEAFTRPAMMHGLAKIGFTQSYTYFTWRDTAAELREYAEELVAAAGYMRPSFWPNTPDILPPHLQDGGPPMFKIRAVLAAMLSPSWGLYSGYELYEHVARPGVEEYAQNEKYQLRPRDWAAAEAAGESLAPFLARLNAIRREQPALHWLRNLRFHEVDNEAILCWSKRIPPPEPQVDLGPGPVRRWRPTPPAEAPPVLVVCSFDPANEQWANLTLDMPALGFDWHERFTVRDELTGATYDWGQHNAVRLDPFHHPAHIFTVHRHPS